MANPGPGEREASSRVTRQSAQAPIIEPGKKNCVFCGQLKKKVPGSSTKQSTSQLLTDDAEKKLRRAASIRGDDRILIAISGVGDLVSREVHYHRHCYQAYTREVSLERITGSRTVASKSTASSASSCSITEPDFEDDTGGGSMTVKPHNHVTLPVMISFHTWSSTCLKHAE